MPSKPSAPSATAPRSSLWRAGAIVGGRYRLRGPIGAGAMGEVWSADHISLGTSVAVKLVDTANREDAAETLARFEQEARAAAQLKSPHVVQILDHGTDGRVAFIAMELLEGESLEGRLSRRGRLMPSEVAHVMREMARGVDRAHAAGIVHRDIKPPNVFLTSVEGIEIVKVLDFGIAKFLGVPQAAHLQTQAGFVVGTPAYMSPEQVLGKRIDHRSDLWQMAVLAFECVTGHRPFTGDTLGQLFMSICTAPLPVPSAVVMPGVNGVPPLLQAFDQWFARAAHRDPALRFSSAGEMTEALCAIFAPGGVGESAIPTMAGVSHAAAPIATGSNDAWSTGRVDPPRPHAAPVALLAGLLLAPVAILSAFGLWWVIAHRPVSDAIPISSDAPTAAASAPASPRAAAAATTTTPADSSSAPLAVSAAPTASARRAPPPPAAGPRRADRPGAPKPPVDLGL